MDTFFGSKIIILYIIFDRFWKCYTDKLASVSNMYCCIQSMSKNQMTFVMQCSCISQTNEGSTVCLSKLLYQHSHVFPSWKLFSLQFQPVESCGVLLSKAPYPMQYRQNCWSNLSLASARHVHNAPCSTWRCIPWSVRSLGKLSGIKGGS